MEVVFNTRSKRKGLEALAKNEQWRGKGKVVFNVSGMQTIPFNNGTYRTSDKEEIETLIHSKLYEEGTIETDTDIELVNEYLMGGEPDKLTEDVIKGISTEGLKEICERVGLHVKKHKNLRGVMRAMLRGKPITNAVRDIIKEHRLEETKESLFDKLYDPDDGVIYRNGPWYKFRQEDQPKDFSIGKTEAEVHEWIASNKDKLEDKI